MKSLPSFVSRSLHVAMLCLIVFALLGASDEGTRFNNLGHRLMCMCGCNQVLLECNHVGCTYSDRMRGELIALISKDDNNGGSSGGGVNNDSMILQAFVQKYGNTVLSAPTTTGFNRVAWIMPFAVFAAASVLTLWLVRLWKSRPVAQPVAHPNLGSGELDALRKKARQE